MIEFLDKIESYIVTTGEEDFANFYEKEERVHRMFYKAYRVLNGLKPFQPTLCRSMKWRKNASLSIAYLHFFYRRTISLSSEQESII